MRLVLMLVFCSVLTSSGSVAKAQPAANITAAIRYDLNVRVVPDAHSLEVNGTMTLPASSKSRSSIQLYLSELMRGIQLEVLQPSDSAGAARLENIKVEDGEVDDEPDEPHDAKACELGREPAHPDPASVSTGIGS